MKSTALENKILTIAQPVAKDMGLDVIQVKLTGEGGARTLQVMAENPKTGNVDIDSCAELSRALSAVLDVEDPIQGSYHLEVGSPGIDRPLVCPADFERFCGYDVKIEINPPLNGQKRFRGIIEETSEKGVKLKTDQGVVDLSYPDMEKAKLVMTDALLKAGS